MKKTATIIFLLLCVIILASCDSSVTPLPSQYVGVYGSGQYGDLIVTSEKVSTQSLLLPQCALDQGTIYYEVVKWDPVNFMYYSDQTFNFTAYVESLTSSAEGYASFNGTFTENLTTYDIMLYYTTSNAILFSKSK